MAILDQLITEIALLTGLTEDEVKVNFTQEQLQSLLESSQCEQPDTVGALFDDPEEFQCTDQGNPSDLVKDLENKENFPKELEDAQDPSDVLDDIEDPPTIPDPSPCLNAVNKVNKKLNEKINDFTSYSILLNKLYELQDNIKPLEYYYLEREKRLAIVLNDFKPTLTELKRLKNLRASYIYQRNDASTKLQELAAIIEPSQSVLNQIEIYKNKHDDMVAKIAETNTDINYQEAILDNKTAKYPALSDTNISGFRTSGSVSNFLNAVSNYISESEINDLEQELKKYSEYIKLEINNSFTSYSSLIKTSLISFKIEFQDLNFMTLDKEKYDENTGERLEYTEKFFIKSNPFLEKRSFFESVSGYKIINVNSKEESDGSLYEDYYNKLNDPLNEFFTLEERGLTESSNLVDPNLKDIDVQTKREKDKEYYIKDLNTMKEFNKEFDTLFKSKKQAVRQSVINKGLETTKSILTSIAKRDIETLIGTSTVNLYLPEDDLFLRRLIDNISSATETFVTILDDLQSEITRLEGLLGKNKPTQSMVKQMLREESPACFESMPDDDDNGDEGCPDVHALRGTDPFFESLGGIDPTLPNFSQSCYWREFAKLATLQGLFPMPNAYNELRYWPVGFIIPTPAKLIKIPLPMIWIPLVTISTPLGILVIFLNINGIFISPYVFFVSSSGYKQHILTIRGSSEKFGSDRDDELIKKTIQLPIATISAKEMSKIGGSINAEDHLSDEQKTQIDVIENKKNEAAASGDDLRIKKAIKEIDGIKQQAVDSVKPYAQKMKEASDKGEDIEDKIKEIKENIFKIMDDMGKPKMTKINELKTKAAKRINELKNKKLAAMENGDSEEVKRINEELKSDGLTIKEKSQAYTEDLLRYFDNIPFPKKSIPKESDKINPKPNGNDNPKDFAEEMSSKLSKYFISDDSVKVKKIAGLNIAKHKEDIEAKVPPGPYNVDEYIEKIKDYMNDMADAVRDKIVSKGSVPIDPETAGSQMSEARDAVNDATNAEDIEKKKKSYQETMKNISEKLEQDRNKRLLSLTTDAISSLNGVNVSMDAFAPCCLKEPFSFSFNIPDETLSLINQGISLVKSAISELSVSDLKSLFGGKTNISVRDMRLGLLTMFQNKIPDSLSITKPKADLKSALKIFSGFLNGFSLSQAKFSETIGKFQLDKKIDINLKIIKPIIKNLLSEHLSKNLLKKNFINTNPNDLKAFLKSFIDAQDDTIKDKLQPFFDKLKAIKSAKGSDLNILEKKVFDLKPYGTTVKKLFEAKTLVKMNMNRADLQFLIDEDALKAASSILKISLTPLVSNPLAYVVVAGLGVANQLQIIRDIHPILSADDIPPWERLTMKNILFLVFLDEFNSQAADKTGFFRKFL